MKILLLLISYCFFYSLAFSQPNNSEIRTKYITEVLSDTDEMNSYFLAIKIQKSTTDTPINILLIENGWMFAIAKRNRSWTHEKYINVMKDCLLNNKALVINIDEISSVYFTIPIKNCGDTHNIQADSLLKLFESEKQYRLYTDPSLDCLITRLFDNNIFVELNEGDLFASYRNYHKYPNY